MSSDFHPGLFAIAGIAAALQHPPLTLSLRGMAYLAMPWQSRSSLLKQYPQAVNNAHPVPPDVAGSVFNSYA